MYLECINTVMTVSKPKGTHLQIRIREEIKEDLLTTAELRGLSMSALVHSLIVKAVREEKEREPMAFQGDLIEVENKGDVNENQPKKSKNKKAA